MKQKKILLSIIAIVCCVTITKAQNNTFPITGNVGIGTTTPSSKLEVTDTTAFVMVNIKSWGDGANVNLQRANSSYSSQLGFNTGGLASTTWYAGCATGASNFNLSYGNPSGSQFVIATNGNVGIGTNAPGKLLDVVASSTPTLRVKASGSSLTGNPTIAIDRKTVNQRSTLAFRTNNIDDWTLGCTNITGNAFVLNGLGGTALYVDPTTNNLGVGTSTPLCKLTVSSASDSYGILNTNGTITMGTYLSSGAGAEFGTKSNHNLGFFTNNGGPAATLATTGNFGIGTQAPAAKLHITSTSPEVIRLQANNGYLSFYNAAGNYCSYIQNFTSDKSLVIGLDGSNTTGNIRFNTSAGPAMIITNTTQRVGINVTSPNGQFELSLDEGRKPSSSLWTITSDERLKNIEGSYTKGLSEILKLNPIVYHYKNVDDRKFDERVLKTKNVGFSAQEVQKVFPECVGKDEDGYLNLNMHAILIAEVNAIKEQQFLIETKDKQIAELQNQNKDIVKQLNEMKECLATLCNASQNNVYSKLSMPVEQARLLQNQPNPFNQTTVIKYFVPASSGNAVIKITSHEGVEIKSIPITVMGIGSIEINANSMSSGVYNYQLIVDGKTVDTKQMILTR